MAKTLDKSKPYSEVQGDSRAAYYQGGKFFYADGTKLKKKDAGKPSNSGSFANAVQSGVDEKLALENSKKPLKVIDETNTSTNSKADIKNARKRAAKKKTVKKTATAPDPKVTEPEKPKVEKSGDLTQEQIDAIRDRRAGLEKIDTPSLKKLVEAAGGEPITGRGSKKANIKWLMDNTE